MQKQEKKIFVLISNNKSGIRLVLKDTLNVLFVFRGGNLECFTRQYFRV